MTPEAQTLAPELWLLLRVLLSLTVVLAAAFISLKWLLPRFANGKFTSPWRRADDRRLRLVETLNISREQRVLLIEVERDGSRHEIVMAFAGSQASRLESWSVTAPQPQSQSQSRDDAPSALREAS